MIRDLDLIVKTIAEDAIMVARSVLDRQGLGNGKISSDLSSSIDLSGNPVINLLFNNYLTYIESGRKAGSAQPPISTLRDWALSKGLPVDNNTLYAIARSIARDGIKPRPILVNVIEELEHMFEATWADTLFECVVEQISELFVD